MDKAFLLAEMQAGPVKIKFRKVDGSLREMTCTLNEGYLPPPDPDRPVVSPKAPNPEVQSVWDLEKEAWRSFRWDRLVVEDDQGLG
jgi:hypothetical protein